MHDGRHVDDAGGGGGHEALLQQPREGVRPQVVDLCSNARDASGKPSASRHRPVNSRLSYAGVGGPPAVICANSEGCAALPNPEP
jgi:hypothetical protein